MSPITPAGKAARRKGRLVAVWTSATSVAEWESEVISHAAPTFCIQTPKFATRDANHRDLKRDDRRGAQVDTGTSPALDIDAPLHPEALSLFGSIISESVLHRW
jgi:hypothetical protein